MTGPTSRDAAPPRLAAQAARMRRLLRTVRHPGTNGWTSTWGTNAHGEIAGCPPPSG
ncbi:hypothetical protein [Janibacter sp. Soil728]|uniref:hypothetical protein n=1 Tax=Janibacter sp. Soil728 TaxID=1736393 RepID=UPI001910FEF4|nr:hypothetical protein [Janibacter sp. Soil728]